MQFAAEPGRLPGWPRVLGLGVLALLLGAPMREHADALASGLAPLGILSLQSTCASGAAKDILAEWASLGLLDHAWRSLAWDCGFAVAYGLALSGLGRHLAHARRLGRHLSRWLAIMPLAAAGLDLAEDGFHFGLLAAYPDGMGMALAAPACACALLKWGLLLLWFPPAATLSFLALMGRLRRA